MTIKSRNHPTTSCPPSAKQVQGGTIAGSINLPAQSLYATMPTLYNLVKSAEIPLVIWYCGKPCLSSYPTVSAALIAVCTGSSRGRGNRAAAWFADYVGGRGDKMVKSVVLEGGIAAWATAGDEFVGHMLEYDASVWTVS